MKRSKEQGKDAASSSTDPKEQAQAEDNSERGSNESCDRFQYLFNGSHTFSVANCPSGT